MNAALRGMLDRYRPQTVADPAAPAHYDPAGSR